MTITQLTGCLGAVIGGVRLSGDLSGEQVSDIRESLLVHRVVFFRGQDHLDDEEQRRFAALLGPVTASNPLARAADAAASAMVVIDSSKKQGTDMWHSDSTFLDRPPAFSVLRSIQLPAVGGDTLWANTVSAYKRLGPVLQTMCDPLWARHTSGFATAYAHNTQPQVSNQFETDHPLVRVHPETGERAILLGRSHAKYIVGLNPADSYTFMSLIQSHVEHPDNTVRWSWQLGDLAIWDNRSTQHFAISDYTEHRLLRRVTVAGDVPKAVDGRSSVVITGDASDYSPIFTPPPRRMGGRDASAHS